MSNSSTSQVAGARGGNRHSPARPDTDTRPTLQQEPGNIFYEQPLNERTRTFLRLEFLFRQAAHHLNCESPWDSRATLNCILEIVDIFANTNLKSEVIKELERHAGNLKRLDQNPAVDHAQLARLTMHINTHIEAIHSINGQVASELKNSEFLTGIRQRSAIPGGTCDFDLPAFHYWLQQPHPERTRDLSRWLGSFDAIGQAIQLILGMTRDSTPLKPAIAEGGVYQRTLDPNLPCQLVRIEVPAGLPYFAELSGGRHRFTVRFLHFSAAENRARATDQDVDFRLACCVI
jgi:cell division protein ZapD